VKIRVLGSAAGGGFPQWNCNCPNCAGLRRGTLRARARTQSSIVVSGGSDTSWALVNASPDGDYLLSFAVPVTPGRYRVRFAVADAAGAVGSLETEVAARLHQVGPFVTSDLLTAASLMAAPTKGEAAPPTKEEIEQEKKEIRQKSKEILTQLYKVQPNAKASINKAAGYAVFSNFGMKIFVVGSGKGKGVAVDNKTKKEVFMDMLELQAGLGMGVKKFNLVWVFETPQALATFMNSGWELGGQTSAAAKAGGKGGSFQGAIAVAPGVWLYQLTEAGLALELTAKGTKYYKDDDLN